jgi:putative transposase
MLSAGGHVDDRIALWQRHVGEDKAILAARHALYARARQRNPARWSGNTRDWSHIGLVTLNPHRGQGLGR